ncbi:MAG: nucleoside hydrolase [Kiritimatiellales bacterium]|nr:nucleoside hydrolase [Kiritimatiellales bacterium]
MKKWILVLLCAMATAVVAEPVKIIFDTDMAGDCDDTGALAVLHALADYGECEILAVVVNRKDQTGASAAACDAINTWYGRPDIPIGSDKDGGRTRKPPKSPFTEALRDCFPNDAKADCNMPDALDVYRKALRNAPDKSVVICSVGALSNLDDLLKNERSLVEQKVKKLVVMGAEFPDSRKNKPECNIVIDIPASKYAIENWPGDIIFTGFEVGYVIHAGSTLKASPPRNPVRRAFELRPYMKRPSIEKGKPAYDQTAVLLAVRGAEEKYWNVVRGGRVQVNAKDGHTRWVEDPKGKHAWVKIKRGPRALSELIDRLMVKPPALNPQLPVKMIFDTDLGADIDDALALAVIHGLQNRGEVELLAVTCSKDHPASATVIDMINTWFGRGDIPIGRVVDGKQPEDGRYLMQTVAENFPHDLTPETKTMEAVALLRKTLAAQPDGSVVLAVVGQQTNAARLLNSKPDKFSALTGWELVKQKVRMLSVMAGSFITAEEGPVPPKGNPEWNVKVDVDAAKIAMQEWPTEVVITPYSLGKQLLYPGTSIERDFAEGSPVAAAYRHWDQMPYDRPSWDLVSTFYPSRANLGYFNETVRGRVIVDEIGRTKFVERADGNTIILSASPEQRARIMEAFTLLASDRAQ